MRRTAPLVVSTVVAAALAIAPAAASARWLAPETLAQQGNLTVEPAVAAAPDGTVAALWPRPAGGSTDYVGAVRPAGGEWEVAPIANHTSGTIGVDLVASPDGTLTAAWIASTGRGQAVRTATRAPGGGWGEVHTLSDDARSADQLMLAAGAGGAVVAIWRRANAESRAIAQASVRPAGGSWEPARDVSLAGSDASYPRAAVAADGAVRVVWSRFNGLRWLVETRSKPAGGDWGQVDVLSAATASASTLDLAVSGSGAAVATWVRATSPKSVHAIVKPADGGWSAVHDLSLDGREAIEPQAEIAADGTATVVWGQVEGTTRIIRTATRPAGGQWGESRAISQPGASAHQPTLAMTADGAAVASWIRSDGPGYYRVQAARRTPDGLWSEPDWISAERAMAFGPAVALDGRGNAVVAWDRTHDDDATRHQIQAVGFDGEAPSIDALSIPATATAGTALSFAAQARDVWSPIELLWSFGDGATATGPSATHTFPAPGDRPVTITATDAVGNAASASGTVAVAPMPLPTPPGSGGGQPAATRVTVSAVRQPLRTVVRKRALRVTCRLSAAGRCTVTATIPARAARALGLKVKRAARAYTLGRKTVRIAKPGARVTAAIALDRRERAALGRARTVKVTVKATAGSATATATATLRR